MSDDNVITNAVARVDARLATLEPDALARLEATCQLDTVEWLAFGDKPSRLASEGILHVDAATYLHRIHTNWNGGATVAERIVFLQVMGEYMGRKS